MVEAEKSSSNALATQINLMTRRLEEAKATGLATAGMYQVALNGFGGATSPLPADASTFGVFAWMKSNFAKLPEFIGGAVEFGALSCATNLCRTLGKVGYTHIIRLKEQNEFEGPLELGGLRRKLPS